MKLHCLERHFLHFAWWYQKITILKFTAALFGALPLRGAIHARVPFRVFGSAARTSASSALDRPLGLTARSELPSAQVPLVLVLRSHCAVGHSLGCVVFPERTTLATVKRTANPLVELGLPQSITQQILANQPQPVSSSHGLPLPSALEEPQVHFSRALPARSVPPSGFAYPLDGFLPAIPCRFCFAPAALLGFTLRSFLLPEGIQPVSEWKNPHTVSPVGIPAPKAQAGSTGRGSWVFALPGVPGSQTCY
jgi:hypothetical protein